jgi:hypothetical protein
MVVHSATIGRRYSNLQSVRSLAINSAFWTLAYTSPSIANELAAGGHVAAGEGVLEILGRGFFFFFFLTVVAFFVELLDDFAVGVGFFLSVVVFFSVFF